MMSKFKDTNIVKGKKWFASLVDFGATWFVDSKKLYWMGSIPQDLHSDSIARAEWLVTNILPTLADDSRIHNTA